MTRFFAHQAIAYLHTVQTLKVFSAPYFGHFLILVISYLANLNITLSENIP